MSPAHPAVPDARAPMRVRACRAAALVVALAAGLALPACSSSPDAADTRTATTDRATGPARPALWKVADDDTTIYLFGTVHILPADVDWFGGRIERALRGSDVLVTEILTEDVTPAVAKRVVEDVALLPPGRNLRDMLDDGQRASYEAAMTRAGLPAGAFDRFEPWFAALTLSTLLLTRSGNDTDAGVEGVLVDEAGPGMRREGLETLRFQVGLFDALPTRLQLRYLTETVRMADRLQPMFDAMVASWLAGDARALAAVINQDVAESGLMDALLARRNRAWAGWITRRLDSPGTVFVAVGAGHLAGRGSVQDALARRGILTTRIQ